MGGEGYDSPASTNRNNEAARAVIKLRMKARTIALMVSVLLMGILLGGIVYAHVVLFPPYLSALPSSAVLVNGPYALHDEYFWTMIHPPAVLSLVLALILNWKIPARRKLIAIPL